MEVVTDFKDKKGMLIFFGILELLMGSISIMFFLITLISITTILSTTVDSNQQIAFSSIIISSLMYLVAGAVFITLGIGSIKAKRWARAISLLLSWFTFITGIITLVFLSIFSQVIFNQIQTTAQNDPNIIIFVKIFMYTFLILFLIILPGIFILFYQRESVLKTVQKYDTKERWTDKCPLPLLAISFIFLYTCISPIFYLSYGFVAPFFGTFLVGWPAAVLLIINSAICAYLAIQIYKKNIQSWYYSLYLYTFWIISFLATLLFNDIIDMYKYMKFSANQIAMIENMGFFTNINFVLMVLIFFIPYLVFFFYSKRYFNQNEV